MKLRKEIQLPSFKYPPVTEVVCGIQFKAVEDLSAPHLGLLWQSLQPAFPRYREMPPLMPMTEQFPLVLEAASPLRVSVIPPLPRMWFMNEDESRIVQVQRDRLLTNWKKVSEDQTYPRYGDVSGFFFEQLDSFRAFLKHTNLPDLQPLQYELTYVNHLPKGMGWKTTEDIGVLMPDFGWRPHERFLPEPETLNFNLSFVLPGGVGRLHVSAVNAVLRDLGENLPIVQLTLTVRGIDKSKSFDNMRSWFELSREWIVRAFADLTGPVMQKEIWRRTE